MCYSAQLEQDHRAFLRAFPDARVGIREFAKLVENRLIGKPVTITKAMEHSFLTSDRTEDASIAEAIKKHSLARLEELRGELAHQEQRVESAKQELAQKETKKWAETLRIASSKVRQYQQGLADLECENLLPKDSRGYPSGYASVLVQQDGERVILPMRYLLRRQGHPAGFDKDYPGCYSARRDNLTKFWKKQFSATRGIVLMQAFYENVSATCLSVREPLRGWPWKMPQAFEPPHDSPTATPANDQDL